MRRALSTASSAIVADLGGAAPASRAGTAAAAAAGASFDLSADFLRGFAPSSRPPPFGYGALGEFVFRTRYARPQPGGGRESWQAACARVVRGTYRLQARSLAARGLGWDGGAAQASAQEMYERMFAMKFLPPGRGLWAMGTVLTEGRAGGGAGGGVQAAALNNCAFVSTAALAAGDPARPFCFLMEAAMLGVGVGFDVAGAGTPLRGVDTRAPRAPHAVADSREGWVASLRALLRAHFLGGPAPAFDYSAVRPRGAPIAGFGGAASGPEALAELHAAVDGVLAPLAGRALTVTALVDVMNLIGRCIVSGDARQTAEIAFGGAHCAEYAHLKDYARNPARAAWGWTSNNSVYAPLGMDYAPLAARVRDNGEPGFFWLDNARAYGRMGAPPDHADARAAGGNPCLEQTLESEELCCLVETFPARHCSAGGGSEDLADYAATLRTALLYAKTVTLAPTGWPASDAIMARNRRIGCSMSGVAQFLAARGVGELTRWADEGYAALRAADAALSAALGVPASVKLTSIKPSGTVSLLAGATPGMHWPEARHYLRRVRVSAAHETVAPLRAAGYAVEPAAEDPARKVVITFPVHAQAHGGAGGAGGGGGSAGASAGSAGSAAAGGGSTPLRTLDEVSMWEQFALAALLQRCWADNQVSCTVTFCPESEGPAVPHALDYFQYQLKGISLLPRPRGKPGVYAQMPYEAIDQARYERELARLRPIDFSALDGGGAAVAAEEPPPPDLFCDADGCEAPPQPQPAAAQPPA